MQNQSCRPLLQQILTYQMKTPANVKVARVAPSIDKQLNERREERIRIQRWKLEADYRKELGDKLFDRIVIDGKPIGEGEAEAMRSLYLNLRDKGAFEDTATMMVDAEDARKHLTAIIKNHINELNA
jgi:hypothetical protein